MKEKIAIISFTRQGFSLAQRMRDVLDDLPDDFRYIKRDEPGQDETAEQNTEKRIALYTTKESVAEQFPYAVLVTGGLRHWCGSIFPEADALIFVGASGIAVRTIAPFLVSKVHDPAVLVADERGKHVISLLSGHLGGGNALTSFLAERIGADPVITTASDVNEKLAIDVWAKKNHLMISDPDMAKRVAAEIVDGKKIPFYCDGQISGTVPDELVLMKEKGAAPDSGLAEISVVVSASAGERLKNAVKDKEKKDVLHLIPRSVILGVGCRKGKALSELWEEVSGILEISGISSKSICKIASIDLKADEEGLLQLSDKLQVPFETFSAETLRCVPGEYTSSAFVKNVTGVDNVCERAAMASLTPEEQITSHFLLRKTVKNGVTAALLEKKWGVDFE